MTGAADPLVSVAVLIWSAIVIASLLLSAILARPDNARPASGAEPSLDHPLNLPDLPPSNIAVPRDKGKGNGSLEFPKPW